MLVGSLKVRNPIRLVQKLFIAAKNTRKHRQGKQNNRILNKISATNEMGI